MSFLEGEDVRGEETPRVSFTSKVKGLSEALRTDTTAPYYTLAQVSLRKYTPMFALIVTVSLMVFYYWNFLNSQTASGSLPQNFYLTLYCIAMSLTIFALSSVDSRNSLNDSFMYVIVLSLSVYTLLGGIVYNNPDNPYVLPIAGAVMLLGAVIHPNFWVFIIQSLGAYLVFLIPYLLKGNLQLGAPLNNLGGLGATLATLTLVFALSLALNRYVYVFVSKMSHATQMWMEKSTTDGFTKFLNRESFSEVFFQIATQQKLHTPTQNLGIPLSSDNLKSYENLLSLKKAGKDVYFYLVDIDDLKKINDVLGHVEGDNVILAVSEALKRVFPERSLISRWGGDEFAVLTGEHYDRATVENGLNAWLSTHAETLKTATLKDSNESEGGGFFKAQATISEAVEVEGLTFKEVLAVSDSSLYSSKKTKKTSQDEVIREENLKENIEETLTAS